jgi:hypothetical protein
MMAMSFELDRPLTREEARRIIVDCADEYSSAVNNDDQIRPYLETYPFKGIEIRIFTRNADGNNVYHPYISVVSFIKGMFKYCTDNPVDKYDYKTIHRESYEEAKEILKQQAQASEKRDSIKKHNLNSPPTNPTSHQI